MIFWMPFMESGIFIFRELEPEPLQKLLHFRQVRPICSDLVDSATFGDLVLSRLTISDGELNNFLAGNDGGDHLYVRHFCILFLNLLQGSVINQDAKGGGGHFGDRGDNSNILSCFSETLVIDTPGGGKFEGKGNI